MLHLLFVALTWKTGQRIPREEFELDGRRQIACSLLRRLPNILNPRGHAPHRRLDAKGCLAPPLRSRPRPQASRSLTASSFPQVRPPSDGRLARLQCCWILSFVDSPSPMLSRRSLDQPAYTRGPRSLLPTSQITINCRSLSTERCLPSGRALRSFSRRKPHPSAPSSSSDSDYLITSAFSNSL